MLSAIDIAIKMMPRLPHVGLTKNKCVSGNHLEKKLGRKGRFSYTFSMNIHLWFVILERKSEGQNPVWLL